MSVTPSSEVLNACYRIWYEGVKISDLTDVEVEKLTEVCNALVPDAPSLDVAVKQRLRQIVTNAANK